jgi:hypothetical protein
MNIQDMNEALQYIHRRLDALEKRPESRMTATEVNDAMGEAYILRKRVAYLQCELVSMEKRAAETDERAVRAVSLYSQKCDRNIALQHLVTSLENERTDLERLRDELAGKLKESQTECAKLQNTTDAFYSGRVVGLNEALELLGVEADFGPGRIIERIKQLRGEA